MPALPVPLILDGGLSNQLEAQGCDLNHPLWSARLLRDAPRAIVEAHLAYYRAGADCVITSSYQASLEGLRTAFGVDRPEATRLLASTTDLAVQARTECLREQPGRQLFVAASIGPYGAVLHDGSEYTGDYAIGDGALRDFHRERLDILAATEADLLACETQPSGREILILADLLYKYHNLSWMSCSCRDGQHLNDGTPLREVARALASVEQVFAVGVNCTAPRHISSLVRIIREEAPHKRVVVYPNSGEVYDASSGSWSAATGESSHRWPVQQWRDLGADIIGGCCQVGPQQIAAIRRELIR